MYGPYQSGTARPYKMGGRLDWLSLVRAVPNLVKAVPSLVRAVPSLVRAVPSLVRAVPSLVRAVPSLVRAVPSLVRAVPESPKTPFLRVFCSNPAENKQTLSSTKF